MSPINRQWNLERVHDYTGLLDKVRATAGSEAKQRSAAIVDICARYVGVTTNEIMNGQKRFEMMFARHIAMYLLFTEMQLSFNWIKRFFGMSCHSTPMYARKRIASLLEQGMLKL